MADFTLSAEVIVMADRAISDMNKLEESTSDMVNILQGMDSTILDIAGSLTSMSEKSEQSGNKSTMSINRMAKAIGALSAIAAVAFGTIVSWSPSLSAAFGLIELNIGLAAMSIGENLAPIINDTLLPAIESISNAVQNLHPQIQQWIGLTIALTVVTGILAGIIIVLSTIGLTLVGTIALIIASVAAIIIIIMNWKKILDNIVNTFHNANNKVKAFMVLIGLIFSPIILAVGVIILLWEALVFLVKHLDDAGKAISWFGGLLSGFADSARDYLSNMKEDIADLIADIPVIGGILSTTFVIVAGILESMADSFFTLVDVIGDVITAIGKLLEGDFTGVIEAVGEIVLDIINFFIRSLNNIFIDSYNSLLETIADWGITPGWLDDKIRGYKVDEIPELHEGTGTGVVNPTGASEGLYWLKQGETVRTQTQETTIQNRLAGGGSGTTVINNYNVTVKGGTYTSPRSRRREARMTSNELKKLENQRRRV